MSYIVRYNGKIKLMWLKQCHKPPMTGNGNHSTYKIGDDWGMNYDCFLTTLAILITRG